MPSAPQHRKVDLPEPEGPTIKIPTPSTDTQVKRLILITYTHNGKPTTNDASKQMSRPFVLDEYFQPKSPHHALRQSV